MRVRLPRRGRRKQADGSWDDGWTLLTVPGEDNRPLCTSLAGATAWLEDYRRRGCIAELVPLDIPRGPTYRPKPRTSELELKTDSLF